MEMSYINQDLREKNSLRLTGQETSIKYIELLVVMSSFSNFHGIQVLLSPNLQKMVLQIQAYLQTTGK